ncbi:MAG TPA: hypothetical protein VHB97_19565 [Polyangia bacterium]|nr:hypothetical protein [Polyangia bacterium]
MRAAIAVFVIALLASCRSGGDGAGAAARARVAMVQGLGGKVDVLRGGAVDWSSLTDGSGLYEDDRLRTFKGAWAKLAFEGGSSLRVGEETMISFGGGVTIERGVVEGELSAGLRLKTPTLEAETATSRDIEFR